MHPFDFRKLAAEFRETVGRYADGAGDAVDFAPVYQALESLQSELNGLYEKVASVQSKPADNADVRKVNDAILELGRILIPINFTRNGRFRNEPAISIPPLPDIAPAQELKQAKGQ